MMRKYFENITGVATGTPNLTTSLLFCGFNGEAIHDERTLIKKSHFPMTDSNLADKVKPDYIIVCTRYELDVEPSNFQMAVT